MDFKIGDSNVRSASEIRKMYRDANADQRKKLIHALYGSVDNEILDIFDSKIN